MDLVPWKGFLYTMVSELKNNIKCRGTLIEAHIADLHFGCSVEPKTEYEILKEQFIDYIALLPKLDIISINGDIFDRKFMANSDAVLYAIKFVDDLVNLARLKSATLLILAGTLSHDVNQLKLFYHYMQDNTVDVRIIETIKFEIVKGARVLCIPELYGIDESIYEYFFHQSGWYDFSIVHGTCKGAVYGDNVGAGRLLVPEDFSLCKGPVLSGHVHKPGCFFGWYYYSGSPLRYKFNEEEAKGFLLVAHNLDNNVFYINFEEITSFNYITIYIDELISEDPKNIIDYINNRKINEGIDFIKVRFRINIPGYNKTIINNYYRNNHNVSIEFIDASEAEKEKHMEELEATSSEYSYLMDQSISDLERFCMFVNASEKSEFITVDKLTEILNSID